MGELVAFPRKLSPASLPTGPSGTRLWREAVGAELRRTRHAAGATIAAVAEHAGVSPQYLSEVERGRKDPSSEMLDAMAGALGLDVVEVVGGAARQMARNRPAGPVLLAA